MEVLYYKWLEIEVQHDYFKDGLCPVIRFEPFAETAKIFNNYNILARRNGALLSFYIGLPSTDAQSLFETLQGIDVMRFQVLVEDPLFYNYTNLPAASENAMFLFSNTAGDFKIHKNDTVSAADFVSKRQESVVLATNCIGIAQIDMAPIVSEANQDKKLTLTYKVKEVYWKYKIVLPTNRAVTLSIESVNESIVDGLSPNEKPSSYTHEGADVLPGEQIADVYISPTPKQLQEHLEKHPTLTISYTDPLSQNITQTQDIKLPNPSPEYLEAYLMPDGTKALCAQTIVYV